MIPQEKFQTCIHRNPKESQMVIKLCCGQTRITTGYKCNKFNFFPLSAENHCKDCKFYEKQPDVTG